MENCLIKKLKGNVNNPNLIGIGELKFKVESGKSIVVTAKQSGGSHIITKDVTMTIDGNVYTDYPITGVQKAITFSDINSNSEITITNKYNLNLLRFNLTPVFQLDDLAYSKELTYLLLDGSPIEGDVSVLCNLSKLGYFGFIASKITGNYTDFLNRLATHRNNGEYMNTYVNELVTNVPEGIGDQFAYRGKVVFDGNGGWTVTTP